MIRASALATLALLLGAAVRLQPNWLAPGPSAGATPGEPVAAPLEPSREPLKFAQDVMSASLLSDGPTALDGMSLAQVLAFRKARVREHASLRLFPARYDPMAWPSTRIYAQITPGARWLGPTAYYVANPYVLVVLVCANHVTPLNLACPEVGLHYTYRRIEEVHAGAAARCWFDRVYDPPYADNPGSVRVVIVNAFDAGLRYAHVDLAESTNLLADASPSSIVNGLFEQSSFFHLGKYRANNISPEDRKGWLRLRERNAPTLIHVKLWEQRPATVEAPADLAYVVRVRP